MKKLYKRIIAFLVASTMLSPYAYAKEQKNAVNISFDDCITNDMSEYVDVVGPSNARVVEDGARNKSYSVDCSYVDGEITIMLPDYGNFKKFTALLDMRIEGACGGGSIDFVTKNETIFNAFVFDEHGRTANAKDNRFICNINNDKMSTVAMSVNNELKLYNCCGNDKLKLDRRPYTDDIDGISKIVIKVNAPNEKSVLYLDNVRLYEGTEYFNKKERVYYNPNTTSFEEVDESQLANKVYYYNDLNSASSLSMSYYPMGNTLEYMEEDTPNGKNGYMRFTKINSNGIYTYQTVGKIGKHTIIEADVRHGKKTSCGLTFILIDSESSSSRIVTGPFTIYDSAITGGGTTAALKKNIWNKISLAVDYTKHTFDVYLNGIKVIKDKSISSQMNTLSELRFSLPSGTELGTIDVDNIAIYSGNKPRDVANAEITHESRFEGSDNSIAYLRGKTAIQTYSNTMYADNKKQTLEHECINIGDESLVPADAFEKLFKKKVSVNGSSIKVGDDVLFKAGEKTVSHKGKITTIDEAPVIKDGIAYIPAVAYGNMFIEQGTFCNDNHGMLIVGKAVTDEDARKKNANLYLFFERKSADELKAQLCANTNNLAAHPRLMMTPDSVTKLREEIKTDPYKKKWFESLKLAADTYLNQEPAVYKLSSGRLLDLANSTLSFMETMGFVYQMTQDKKYGERTVRELEAIASFTDWAPQISFLETATFSSAFAIGFDWAYDCMDADTAKKLAERAQALGLQNAELAYTASASFNDFWWNTETNWGIICNGGISNLAIATAEYNTDKCMEILREALRSIEFTWYRFAPDGAWHEGPGYWSYMLTHLSRFESSYLTAMGEPFAANYRGFNKYGYFQCYVMGPDNLSNNFHDADLQNIQSEGQFILAKICNDNELMRYRREQIETQGLRPCAEDIIWYDAKLSNDNSPVKLENDSYFRETEFVAIRENWYNSDSAWLSYHGGEMSNAHDHIDVGTYIFNIGGVRWAIDLGKEPLRYVQTNNPATSAGYTIYDFYRARAEGHNSVVINPSREVGMNVAANTKVAPPVSGAYGTIGKIDMSKAYSASTTSYLRGYKLSDSRRTFTLRDEINLLTQSDVYWFMHTKGSVRIIDSNTAIIYQDGKALKVQIDCNKEGGVLSVVPPEPLPTSPKFNMSSNEGVSKLCYKINTGDVLNITAKMSLAGEIGSESGVDTTPISNWDVNAIAPGRTYSYSKARLSSLKLDGTEVADFSPEKYLYTSTKHKDGTAPVVTAESNDGAVTVEPFKGVSDKDMSLITVKGYDGKETYYVVEFDEYSLSNLNAYDSLPLKPLKASSEEIYLDKNLYCTLDKAVDGDLSTRWASNGTKEWGTFDLGEVKDIDAFAVACWMGNERSFNFDIYVSDDNINYTRVMSVTTDGKSASPVVYIPDKNVRGRYIKFSGHGNSVNDYNHVSEFMALKIN